MQPEGANMGGGYPGPITSCAASVRSIEAHQVSLRDSQLLRSEEKTALALLRGSGGFIYTERRDVILGYLQKE
jgi:hypothetical protein